jgi:hypothetical protein
VYDLPGRTSLVYANFIFIYMPVEGAHGGIVVKALRYKPAGRGFDSQWCNWNFSLTQYFQSHYGLGVETQARTYARTHARTHTHFSDRVAILHTNTHRAERKVTKGCPQGSCCGPRLWNVLYNDLLNMKYSSHTKLIAFADDIAILTYGKTPNLT